MMKRLVLAAATTILVLPSSALAASSGGVVLSVDSGRHVVQVVDGGHFVHAYRYRGHMPKVHAGSLISFQRAGQTIASVLAVSNSSHTVSFFGRVLRLSAGGLVVRLADGSTMAFSSKQILRKRAKPARRHTARRHKHFAHRAIDIRLSPGGMSANIRGLQPGVTVLVIETMDSQGGVAITITLPARGSSGVSGEQQASGVVSEVNTDAFVLHTADGSDLRLHMANDTLANLNLQICYIVNITYHQAAGMLIADQVQSTGTSSSGRCATSQDSLDAVGTITQVSATSVTISTDQGPLTLSIDPSAGAVTDGFLVGDMVDVTYSQNGYGSLSASDIQYVQQDVVGTVTAVSVGSITITDVNTRQPDTITADPSQAVFAAVAIGDQIDVTYHESSGQLIADAISDQGQGQ
jgi:hypothetical protein